MTAECQCGGQIEAAAGKYGCPSCHGDSMTTRQAIRRQRILAGGGCQLAILLGPDATAALELIQRTTGLPKTAVVSALLIEAADKLVKREVAQ